MKQTQPTKDIHDLLKEVVGIFGNCTLLLEIKTDGSLRIIAVGGDIENIESIVTLKKINLDGYIG